MPTIALGSLFTECNHLGGTPLDLAAFERQELRRGSQMLDVAAGTIGGMLATLSERGANVAPLLVASTCPGGPLTTECHQALKIELLDRLSAALPVDGVLLALHGAAAAEGVSDLEGDLLASVRALIGAQIPIVATLDLHAHVTALMVHSADALLAWETYPHSDAYTTGVRGARMLLDIYEGKLRPAMVLAKVPVVVSGVNGQTEGAGPFADVMRFAKSHEGVGGVVSTSVFLVHPYLDVPDMGGGGLVITNGDLDQAELLAREIARRYWQRRFDLDPLVFSPAEAIERGLQSDAAPILLVEAADCCGGGAAGDSVATLRALVDRRTLAASLVPVVDPWAAARCHEAGVGREVMLALGHRLDPKWGESVSVTGRVARLGDGRFRYRGGIWEGQPGDMGPSAVLEIGNLRVLVATHATYDWADEQYQSLGLVPRSAKFVVVKNPMNFRLGYAGIAQEVFILDTPGPTPPVLRHVGFQNLRRPYYPADREIPGLSPTVVRHGA